MAIIKVKAKKKRPRKAPIKEPSLVKRKEIRERLDRFRKHLELSQDQFGELAKVSSQNTIDSWFSYRDPTVPSREVLYVLGEESNLSLNWLLWEDEPMLRVNVPHDAELSDKFRAYFKAELAALGFRVGSLDKVLPGTELLRFLAQRLLPEILAEESMFPEDFRDALKPTENDPLPYTSLRNTPKKK